MVLFAVKTSFSANQYVERRQKKEEEQSRTGEYALLFGFVFVAAVITMAIIAPQIAHLMLASAGS